MKELDQLLGWVGVTVLGILIGTPPDQIVKKEMANMDAEYEALCSDQT